MNTVTLNSKLSDDGTLTFEVLPNKTLGHSKHEENIDEIKTYSVELHGIADERKIALASIINFQHQRYLINQGRVIDKNLLGQEFK